MGKKRIAIEFTKDMKTVLIKDFPVIQENYHFKVKKINIQEYSLEKN